MHEFRITERPEKCVMRRREASINDVPITESERRLSGPRPEDERGPQHDIPLR